MTENKLYEKFTWLKQDLIYAGPKGNKAQFKGVALLPTISGNGRKYVEEELHRSARTLVGKPLTLNHNSNKVLGDVTWAEFENGSIEYVAETKNPEYIEKLRDCKRLAKEAYIKKWGRDPLYGVSVEANYRFHDAQCAGGHCTIEPHGIIFNALSLVEDPERPGVSGTTVEIMETLQAEQRISEMLVKDLVPQEIQSSVLTESQSKVTTMPNNLKEECGCPPGQHKDESGECVPDEESNMDETLLDIKHQMEKADLRHAKEFKAVNESLAKTKQEFNGKVAEVSEKQQTCCSRLGETQKALLEVEAIAKGTLPKLDEKADAKTVTDSLQQIASTKADASTVSALKESMDTFNKTVQETLAQTATKTQLTEALNGLPKIEDAIKPLQEKIENIPNVTEAIKPLQETIAKMPNLEEALKPIRETLNKIDVEATVKPLREALAQTQGKLAEIEKKHDTLNTVYEALEKKHTDFVKETEAKKLQETQESTTKMQQLQETIDKMGKTIGEQKDEIDTLRLHVPPNFKAKTEEKKPEPNFSPPYKY